VCTGLPSCGVTDLSWRRRAAGVSYVGGQQVTGRTLATSTSVCFRRTAEQWIAPAAAAGRLPALLVGDPRIVSSVVERCGAAVGTRSVTLSPKQYAGRSNQIKSNYFAQNTAHLASGKNQLSRRATKAQKSTNTVDDIWNSILAGLRPQYWTHTKSPECSRAIHLLAETSRSRRQFSSTVPLAIPMRSRLLHKQYILMYEVNCGQAPKYIIDLVSTVAATATQSGLRSGKATSYCLPGLRTKFGERGFSYAWPAAWNRLPHDIRASTSLNVFKRKLKTHYLQKLSVINPLMQKLPKW